MIVISARDCRTDQTKFLDMVKSREDIILKIKQKESFKLVLLTEDDTVIEKRDFIRNNPF